VENDGRMTKTDEKSKSMEYCEDILKSVDFSESDEEEATEEEVGILPPEAVQVLQSFSLKRSLLETLN
jgi:hypothetical protein